MNKRLSLSPTTIEQRAGEFLIRVIYVGIGIFSIVLLAEYLVSLRVTP